MQGLVKSLSWNSDILSLSFLVSSSRTWNISLTVYSRIGVDLLDFERFNLFLEVIYLRPTNLQGVLKDFISFEMYRINNFIS